MKTVITIRRNEVAAINDTLGTYGSEKRIAEISKSRGDWMVINGSFDPKGNYILKLKVRTAITIGICKIAMDHAPAIKGIVKTLNGIVETVNYLSRNISRDLKNLFREYEEE